jgi:hypothetical protein
VFSPRVDSSLPQVCHSLVALDLIGGPPTFGTPHLNCRPRQRVCARVDCQKPLPWSNHGRPQRFCSTRCQRLASREKAFWSRVEGQAGVVIPGAVKSPPKKPLVSISCKARNGDLYPRAKAPLDLLGGGRRWPGGTRLDRDLRRRIIEQEIGA